MLYLKNISEENITLVDLGEQLLEPNDTLELDSTWRKERAANSSQVFELLASEDLAVIDHDLNQITDLTLAIDALKGFQEKNLKSFDDKVIVHSTSRPIGTFTVFASEGDNPAVPTSIGGGTQIKLDHVVSDPLTQSIYVDLNVKENITYLQEGYAFWKNANFDKIILEVVPTLTVYSSGSNTYYNLYGGYLIIPAAGDGTTVVNSNDIRLVEIPFSLDDPTKRQGLAFWNADYDAETHTFSNITPAPNGDGAYNMFGAEVVLQKIVNILLLDSGHIQLNSHDVAAFGHGMRIKITLVTSEPDHAWKFASVLTLDRTKTC